MATGIDKLLSKDATLAKKPDSKLKPRLAKRGRSTHLQQLTRITNQVEEAAESDIVEIDPNLIDFSEDINHREQSWLSADNKGFADLMESIELAGQTLPIMVRPKQGGRYELVYGSRRRQATLNLGINVKAIIARKISDSEAHKLAILENTNQSGLSPIEEARAVLALTQINPDTTNEDVAIIFSKSKQWVSLQNSFANLDKRFIDQCSAPWAITERGTRQFRSAWTNKKQLRDSWVKQLSAMKKKGEKLPFNKLIELLTSNTNDFSTAEIKTPEGVLMAEVLPVKKRAGKLIRTIRLHESFDKNEIAKIIAALDDDFNAEFNE